MAYSGDDQVLIRIAIFGVAMSVMCTAMITVIFADDLNGDYTFDEIQEYRQELSEFTGESMLNQTPWKLVSVYTPWLVEYGYEDHIDDDGWLYGSSVTDYPYLGKVEGIKLDPEQKSSRLIGVSEETYKYLIEQGDYIDEAFESDAATYLFWLFDKLNAPYSNLYQFLGTDQQTIAHQGLTNLADIIGLDTTIYGTGNAHAWNYTGYRYVLDPCLPIQIDDSNRTSVVDGSLSVVWYSYNGQEGLSGAIDIYGGDVLLASYSATDIVTAYNTSSGHATHYDFDFGGTTIDLYIQFDEAAIQSGIPLMQAWTTGQWSMAISSLSVGNFLDIDNSTSYATTGGNMVKTFIQIYTLSLPNIDNEWMNIVLWLLVGLPMTLAMALITLKIMEAVKIL